MQFHAHFFHFSIMSDFSANVDSSMNSSNGGKAPLLLHRAGISHNYGTNSIFQGNHCGSSFVRMNSFLKENAACCDYIALTLANYPNCCRRGGLLSRRKGFIFNDGEA
jgi:hypothetical protein